ncbi:MAG: sulfotransferase [Pseudomonadota bacterium]
MDQRATLAVPFQVALLHIPKTGGMAVGAALIEALQTDRVARGFDLSMFGAIRDFGTMSPSLRSAIFDNIQDLPREADLILGHKSHATLREVYPDAKIICLIREPRSRVLSHWTYWRSLSGVSEMQWGTLAAYVQTATGRLKDMLTNPLVASQIDNCTLRMLMWPDPRLPDADFIAERHEAELLAEAKSKIDQIAFASIYENWDLDAELSQFLGAQFERKRVNETPPTDDLVPNVRRELDGETLAALEARCRLDAELWLHLCSGVDGSARRHEADAIFLRSVAGYIARGVMTYR